MLISLAVARMITPMIAAYFLKAKGEAKHGEGWLMDRYLDVLRWTLVHRWKTVGIGFACFVLQIFAFATLPFTFQPNTDDDTVQVSVEMPPGVTLDQTRVGRRTRRGGGARRSPTSPRPSHRSAPATPPSSCR